MKGSKLVGFAAIGFSLALLCGGCVAKEDDSAGSGGASASGGAAPSGGAHGGTVSSGGSSSAGDHSASGGATSSGGATGQGGTMGSGGAASSRGDIGTSAATGGSTSGGMAGAGGTAGLAGTGDAMVAGAGGRAMSGTAGTAGAQGGRATGGTTGSTVDAGSAGASGAAMTLTSPDHAEGAKFGTAFTCAAQNGTFGAGVNPQLDWSGVPDGTKSFAITFIDTKIGANQAMGQHWAAWDIPATVRQLPKGTTTLTGDLAGALQTNKYLAPCPSGNDTYELTLYALAEAKLNVTGASGSGTSNSAGVAKVLAALQAVRPLATATLRGTSGPKGQ